MLEAQVARNPLTLPVVDPPSLVTVLKRRFLATGLILSAECLAISAAPHPWCSIHREMAGAIAFCGALVVFGRKRLAPPLQQAIPPNRAAMLLHTLALLLIAVTQLYLIRFAATDTLQFNTAVVWWYAAIMLLVASAVAAAAPLRTLGQVARNLGGAWGYAALCATLAATSRPIVEVIWDAPESRLGKLLQIESFRGVQALLNLFYRGVVSDPATATIGTRGFQVQIAGGCSGIEGVGLMLVLSVGWLIYARRELRMSRALWLVPISLCTIWLTNLIRITALIAIGNAGYESVAVGGFHSEAGWILFNCVAIAFLLAVNQLAWLHEKAPEPAASRTGLRVNLAAVYLLPFLAILAASIVAGAVSSGFEWLYPLRLVAAVAAVWLYRDHLRSVDWRFDWLGPAAGVAIFILWLGFARYLLPANGGQALASSLASLSPVQRFGWIAARVLAAVITVPIAEELAFRGFVARRIVAEDVDAVPYRHLTLIAILASSLLFGVMHGRLWLAGTLAGLAFAFVARRRNRLGEAVAAHAVANLLIAVWVLATGDYGLW